MSVYRALSLGAGQGSTALVIAIADKLVVRGFYFGDIHIDRVAFADTGGELEATYRHIGKLRKYLAKRGMHLDIVRAKGLPLREKILARARGQITSGAPAIPLFLKPEGKAKQFCTYDYKSVPLDRAVKAATRGVFPVPDEVEIVIGFTCEEIMRMRGPREDWPEGWTFRYPMIEAGVNRGWAQEVCKAALGYVPQSSACSFCPHRPDTGPGGRKWIKENEPETWARVVELDAAIRHDFMGLRQEAYISKLRLPVEDALKAASAQGEFWDENGSEGCDDGRCFT